MTVLSTSTVERAVHLSSRAPSYHNSQPWRWVLSGESLQLYLDPNHLVAGDTSRRQSLISCGAVLDHLQVAMAAAGWAAHVDRFPSPIDPTHLASVSFTTLAAVTRAHRRRADAILVRRTDRLPFSAPADWPAFLQLMKIRFDDADGFVDSIEPGDREQLAHASELSAILRQYDSAYHAELLCWTRPFATNDGIPADALTSAAEGERVAIARAFPEIHHQNRRSEIPRDEAEILVISCRESTAVELLYCGEKLSKILLEATMAGLATCTLTHVMEHEVTKRIVCALTGRPSPEVLVRVGMAPALEESPVPTPRRPLSDILTVRC